jgi:hypothetical protein
MMTADGVKLSLPVDATRATSIDYDPQALRFVIGTVDGDVLTVRGGSIEKHFAKTGPQVRGVAAIPGTDWIFVQFDRGMAVFLDSATGRIEKLGTIGGGPLNSYVLVATGPQVLYPGKPGQIDRMIAGSSTGEVWGTAGNQRFAELAADPTGRLLAATSDTEGFVHLFDTDGNRFGSGPVFGGIRPHVVFDSDASTCSSQVSSTALSVSCGREMPSRQCPSSRVRRPANSSYAHRPTR